MGKNSKNRRRERLHAETAEELAEAHNTATSNGQEGDYHFFWKDGTPFSQWHPSKYNLDGYSYVCAEQGMMHGKALLFEDQEAADAIMATNSPRKMKGLGQKVRGFKQSTWNKQKEEIVFRNSVAKFTQNEAFREALLATSGTLVEASPSDRIWGIGLHERDARFVPESQWPGLNLLGKILTRVRDELRSGVYDDLINDEESKESVGNTFKD